MARKRRSRSTHPIVIGLTGSIGMGKTTVSHMFERLGVAVCDSDAIVHKLLGPRGKAVEKVALVFPETRSEFGIDRKALGREVFGDPKKLKQLESILHPLVKKSQKQFIARMKRLGKRFVLLDIPLLFETGAEIYCNIVVVVSAPPFIQTQRVLAREGMTREKFARILARQMPDCEKRKRADVVIDTGIGKAQSFLQIRSVLNKV